MKTCEPCHSSRHIFHQTSSSISGVRMYIPCSKGVILTAELTFVVKILCFVSQKSLYRSVGLKGSEADVHREIIEGLPVLITFLTYIQNF